MKDEKDKKVFIENLKKIPIIQASCERSNVSRASVYRWKKEDKKFAKMMEDALCEGEALINDLGEGQLIGLMKDKNFSAVRFWLNHRHAKFRDRMEVTTKQEKQEELTPEQEALMKKALQMASSELNFSNDEENK